MLNVSPPKVYKSGPIHVDYNILAHLRKFPTKLSIYDVLILSKELEIPWSK